MGKSYKDVQGFENYFGYTIIDSPDEESLVKIRVNDKFYSPIELSSEILKELKKRIEAVLNKTVSKAVITVPAYFNDSQRQATRDAGKLAGLDVLRIVNEPTAAALAYGLDKKEAQTIAVYDLGGGTFDISILQIQDGIFEVLSTNGDTFLGGDDFDRAIVDYWLTENNIDKSLIINDKEFSQTIRLAAEKAKKALSQNPVFEQQIGDLNLKIDKATFEQLAQPLVTKTIDCCKKALADAQLTAADIDEVVMVGGSTRVPLVKNTVAQFFNKKPHDDLNPDEVVALGAAIQADVLAGNQKDILLIDITPLSLGIETVGGLMDVIIPRNSKIPTKAARQYTTSIDGQKNLKIAVYQGERDLVEHNRKLGEFVLRGIPPMPAGLPKIDIAFYLDADGILRVKAKELRSNVEQEVTMKASYGLSEEEMALMLLDSIQNAAQDLQIRSLLEARNEANNIILSAEKFVKQNEAILTPEEIAETLRLTSVLRGSVAGDNKDAINTAMADLNEYTTPLAHRAMDVNIAEAMRGKKIAAE
ncbi:mitochondrial-type HSP70 [Daphnia sinensis]|uniref:Mitochondrial-type HSP70 n=1 Tax=Daphnia sinensis TaxID=1820382 RepID=A0AAD5KFV9_9CRUS|nr:mitochondrial-type HSP70 [Daphnia sinensis]